MALDEHVSNDRTFSRVFLLFTPTASLQMRLNSTERWRCVERLLNLFIDALNYGLLCVQITEGCVFLRVNLRLKLCC